MKDVSLRLPTAALDQIDEWADASGLPRPKFYTTALTVGAGIMTSSIGPGFLEALTPAERQYMAASANASVTPEVLLQIVLGGKPQARAPDPELATTELVVSLPDDEFESSSEVADTLGMARESFYALAFVMGARLAASTLDHGRLFPLELLVRSTEGTVTPEMWLRAMMRKRGAS